MRFTKMQGCGNDYIYVNGFEEEIADPGRLAVAMSERHFGVGADGLVLILPSEKGDFRMRMFNLDGSEGEMCGNAARCIGKYVYERGMTRKTHIALETAGGMKLLELCVKGGKVETVTVDMGEPILEAEKIPVKSGKHPVIGERLQILDREFAFTCVSMGNPHGVVFVENVSDFPVEKYGRAAECHPAFPRKANIEFAEKTGPAELKMRVWERGSGETLACGTGASAVLAAAVLNGICGRAADITLTGGTLHIEWREADGHIYMTGPAAFSFDGVWLGER